MVLGDHDLPLIASNFCNLTAFRAIFTHIFTAHTLKRLFMYFRLKFWYSSFDSLTPISLHGTIFPRFKDVFCWFLHWISWMSAIFLFRSSWHTDLESVSRDAHRYESFHQDWSRYDLPLSGCIVIAADTLCDLVTLTFDFLTLVSGHT